MQLESKKYVRFGYVVQNAELFLIINVASLSIMADTQYEQLNKLRAYYGHYGFEIVAFPCNQFGHKEPGNST